jgi:phosphate-selective porin OprO/OprP
MAMMLVLGHSSASGQAPMAPSPAPVTSPAGNSPESLAERLRKMEEMNQKLLHQVESISRQYDGLARQNEALSKTVQELSKRLNDPPSAASDGPAAGAVGSVAAGTGGTTAPYLSESAARPSRSAGTAPSAGASTAARAAPGAGRDSSAPTVLDSAARPSRTGTTGPGGPAAFLPLDAFYDRQRYGYLMQSEDQEFELRVNGLLQADGRMYPQTNQSPVVSDIDIPRMRLYFSGRMTKPIEYQLSFQRTLNNFDVLNAYVNFHYDDRFQFRIGRFKPPYTFEWYKASIWELLAPERSLFALNFGPNRMVGLMGSGFLFQERLEYAVGVFGGARNSYQDFNNGKDVMALIDYKPFFQSGRPELKNFAIGGSLDNGRENNPLVPAVLRTSTNATGDPITATSGANLTSVPFLAFNNNVKEKGQRALWEIHTTYFYKGLSLLGAWDSGRNDFSLTSPDARPVNVPVGGYFVQVGYLLTGETRERLSLVKPLRPFDLRRGKYGYGAFEIQARFSELEVGRSVFTAGLADPNLWTNRAEMIDVGLNWYLNQYTKLYFDWERAFFAQPVYYRPGPGMQKVSDLYWLRLQLYF